jgi:hypothetical protein
VPVYIKLDATDNLLNPTTGYRAQIAVTPAHTERLGDAITARTLHGLLG